jgi:hypothetical protein
MAGLFVVYRLSLMHPFSRQVHFALRNEEISGLQFSSTDISNDCHDFKV